MSSFDDFDFDNNLPEKDADQDHFPVASETLHSGAAADLRRLELLARVATDNYQRHVPQVSGKGKSKKQPPPSSNLLLHRHSTLKGTSWVVRYLPKSISDHFVHKNKVGQFQTWLNNSRGSNMCLLTGGTGVGKTATVYLVAQSLGFRVKEWLNPMSLTQYNQDSNGWDELRGRPLMAEFTDFLLRSSQYPSLPIKGESVQKKSLILVEDFPNFFYSDVPSLHHLVRNYKRIGECPLVFIMSDSVTSDYGVFKLFSKSLLEECDIQEIGFKAVAPSYMTKFANYVLAQADSEVKATTLAEVVASSNGDMRACINSLQFHFQKSKAVGHKQNFNPPAKKQKNVNPMSDIAKSFDQKEDILFLFHAIGKVLYCKRDFTKTSEIELQILNPKCKRIHPLKEVPEHIGDKIGVIPETFFNFLGQNYLTFFSSMDDVVTATNYLSDADTMFSTWILNDMAGSGTTQSFKDREVREEFGLSLAIRGLMFANQNLIGSVWKPMHKPKHSEVKIGADLMIQNTHVFFSNELTSPITQDYYNDVVCMSSLIQNQNISKEKKMFLREYGRMLYTRNVENLLDEADGVGEDEINSEILPSSNIHEQIVTDISKVQTQEEFNIEDVPD